MRRDSAGASALLLACVLVPWGAAAEGPPPPGDAAPARAALVRVRLVSGRIAPMYHHPATGQALAPPNPSSSVDIGKQAVAAYGAASARAFAGPSAAERVELELRVALASAEVTFDAQSWLAVVEHEVSLVAGPDGEIGRWRVAGEAPVEGIGAGAIPRAFERAAQVAAARWQSELPSSAPVAAWLGARGIPLPPRTAPPEVRPRSYALVEKGAPRAPWVLHLDGGMGVFRLADSGGGDVTRALTVRAGISGRMAMAELLVAQWSNPSGDVLAFGGDVGAVVRFLESVELRGGAGAYVESSGFAPTAFVALQYAGLNGPGASRWRVGLELRRWMGTAKVEDPPGDTFAIVLGLERPIAAQPKLTD